MTATVHHWMLPGVPAPAENQHYSALHWTFIHSKERKKKERKERKKERKKEEKKERKKEEKKEKKERRKRKERKKKKEERKKRRRKRKKEERRRKKERKVCSVWTTETFLWLSERLTAEYFSWQMVKSSANPVKIKKEQMSESSRQIQTCWRITSLWWWNLTWLDCNLDSTPNHKLPSFHLLDLL